MQRLRLKAAFSLHLDKRKNRPARSKSELRSVHAFFFESGLFCLLSKRLTAALLKQNQMRTIDFLVRLMRARLVSNMLVAFKRAACTAAYMMQRAGEVEGRRSLAAFLVGNIENIEAEIIGHRAGSFIASNGEIADGFLAFKRHITGLEQNVG